MRDIFDSSLGPAADGFYLFLSQASAVGERCGTSSPPTVCHFLPPPPLFYF